MTGARFFGFVMIDSVKFIGKLNMKHLHVGDGLIMNGGAEFNEVELSFAKVQGVIDMNSSIFKGKLIMDGVVSADGLFMNGIVALNEIKMRSARIDDQVSMVGSEFRRKLDMDNLQVRKSLYLRGKSEFNKVILRAAKVAGQIDMSESIFSEKLNLESISVGQSILCKLSMFGNKSSFDIFFAKVGGSITLFGAKNLPTIDLAGVQINGELSLPYSDTDSETWQDGVELKLTNASVGALNAYEKSWPKKVELTGFTYARLGGQTIIGGRMDIGGDGSRWYEDVLGRQEHYSPQPYEQLGAVLQKEGFDTRAREVLYKGKCRGTDATRFGITWVFRSFQEWMIGYGYYTRRIFWWFLGFTMFELPPN